jgi:hypothetical protein
MSETLNPPERQKKSPPADKMQQVLEEHHEKILTEGRKTQSWQLKAEALERELSKQVSENEFLRQTLKEAEAAAEQEVFY